MSAATIQQSKGRLWFLIIFLTFLFASAVFVFGDQEAMISGSSTTFPTATQRPARQYQVYYERGVFSPTNIRVRVNDMVAFRNDSNSVISVVFEGANSERVSQDIPPASVFVHTFDTQGSYQYYNGYQSSEKGTVTVRL